MSLGEESALKCRQVKKQFIDAASSIMRKEGVEALTVRRLSKELNCNSANVYYYFEDMEELTIYASMEYFYDYLVAVSHQYRLEDGLDAYCSGWKCFMEMSSEHPQLFEKLVYGKYNKRLGSISSEYYRLFPDRYIHIDPYIANSVTSMEFSGRSNHLILGRCIDEGYFTAEEGTVMAETIKWIHIGLLHEIITGRITKQEYIDSFFESFNKLIELFRIK